MAQTDGTRRVPGRGRTVLAVLALASSLGIGPGSARAQDGAALKARHEALRDRLASNPFQRPLVLESNQSSNDLKGEVYAIVDQPFSLVGPALTTPEQWCDLLILHLNVKNCGTSGKPGAATLTLAAGRKFDQPLEDTYKVEFVYTVPASTPDYLRVQMTAENGPLSTRDYRLTLEAVPLDERRSFLHMSYSYAYGTAARFAMQAYLATAGSDKVGFSSSGKAGGDGKPAYIGGVRGVVERNTMRYYLAIESYINSLKAPPAEAGEKRLRDWYAATERYPAQLHEMERDDYLAMKRKEVQRQKAGSGK